MTYSKQTWNNGPGGGTRVTAARLNHMEDGIEAVTNTAATADTSSAAASASSAAANSKTVAANTASSAATTTANLRVSKNVVTGKGDLIVATGSGSVTSLPAEVDQQIIIPAYFYPALGFGISYWNALLAIGAPSIYGVIANPATGPGSGDSNYTAIIAQCFAAGIKVFGYVNTNYGAITGSTVDADVDAWFSLYGVRDIFFDLVTSDAAHVPYFAARAQHVRNGSPTAKIIFNPGTDVHEDYLSLCDIVCNFEGDKTTYDTFSWSVYAQGYTKNWPASKFWHLVYSVSSSSTMVEVVERSKTIVMGSRARGAKYVYMTDDDASITPWDTTASYLTTEAAVALDGNDGRILTSDPSSDVKVKFGTRIGVGLTPPAIGKAGDLFFKTIADPSSAIELATSSHSTASAAAVGSNTGGLAAVSSATATASATGGVSGVISLAANTTSSATAKATGSVTGGTPRQLLFIGVGSTANSTEAETISAIQSLTAPDGRGWSVTYYQASSGIPSLSTYDAYCLGAGGGTDFAGMLNLSKPLLSLAPSSWTDAASPFAASTSQAALTDTDVNDLQIIAAGHARASAAGFSGSTQVNIWGGWTIAYDLTGLDSDVNRIAGLAGLEGVLAWFQVESGAVVGSVTMNARRIGLGADQSSWHPASWTADGKAILRESLTWLVGLS